MRHYQTLASGLAAVWATDNTREALWDAQQRREVYATTGTRITVRVFAGWDFEAVDVQRPDFAKAGYQRGVPMGGGLRKAPAGKSPTFLIRALRDVDGANLDRVQIVKSWLGGQGALHEQVYDVTCSDKRAINGKHRCDRSVGNTVDVKSATYINSIGDALMLAHWKDPAFDPMQRAFYYVRVLEIPTARWTTYDAAFFGGEPPKAVPPTQQERAYTSPIWCTPSGHDRRGRHVDSISGIGWIARRALTGACVMRSSPHERRSAMGGMNGLMLPGLVAAAFAALVPPAYAQTPTTPTPTSAPGRTPSSPSAAECAARADRAAMDSTGVVGGAVTGGVAGAAFGAIVGGGKSAKRGAAAGAIVGGVVGGAKRDDVYKRVYDDCMRGR